MKTAKVIIWSVWAALIVFCLAPLAHCQTCVTNSLVTLSGNMRSANGLPSSNAVITLRPSQAGFIAGCGVNIPTASTCGTSADGSVIQTPNPLTATINTTSGSGSLSSGTYFTVYEFYDALGHVTLASPETRTTLSASGSLVVNPPSTGILATAAGMDVFIGVSSGGETLQGQTSGSASYVQSTALATGASPSGTNTTLCQVTANDAVWPTGTGYLASMVDSRGNAIPGFPMQWQLLGPGTTINLSNGLPYYHGVVTYPVPVLTAPQNHGVQSITGPLNMSGYNIVNLGKLGVGTSTPGYPIDVTNGFINSNLGYGIGGNFGLPNQCIASSGPSSPDQWTYCPISVTSYGAKCDWNGTTGTDDTAAFQAAASAAATSYATTGAPVEISVPPLGCVIAGTVTYGSGVMWRGMGGNIVVPTQTGSCHYTFLAQNADNVAWRNLLINVVSSPGGDNACYNVIQWIDTNGDSGAHHSVFVQNNVIHNSVWGAYVQYAHGTGSLSDVDISGNLVDSPTVYANGDGVHIDGTVSNITINGNRFVNRGDACIGLTSDTTSYVLSGFSVIGNICLQDRVGIDISGATNGQVVGNYVQATTSSGLSSPAYRVIFFDGVAPSNINTKDNYFEAAPNPDVTAKLDINGSYTSGTPPNCNCNFYGNTFATDSTAPSLYLRANRVTVIGNNFEPSGILAIDYNSTNSIATQNLVIGPNAWVGDGTINMGASFSLNTNVQVAAQNVSGTLTFANAQYSVIPNKQPQTITFAGCNFANNAAGSTCTVAPSYPQQFPDTSYTNTCSISSTQALVANAVPAITSSIVPSTVVQVAIQEQTAIGNATGFANSASYGVTWTCTGIHP